MLATALLALAMVSSLVSANSSGAVAPVQIRDFSGNFKSSVPIDRSAVVEPRARVSSTADFSLTQVTAELSRSLTLPGSRLELLDWKPYLPDQCAPRTLELNWPLSASGRYPVRIGGQNSTGTKCQGWAWARVKILAMVIITTQTVAAGGRLDGAISRQEREVVAGHSPLSSLPDGALAAQPLRPGQVLESHHLRINQPAWGESVTVIARSGQVSIMQKGRVVPCVRGRACAQLDSGRRVEGHIEGGQLVVEVP